MIASGTNMNCEDYRQAIAADPSASFDGGDQHASACEACRAFRDEMRALDLRIAKALAIDLPDLAIPELPPLDADDNVVDLRSGRKPRIMTLTWVGVAASIVVATVFGFRFLAEDTAYPSLADEIMAHLDHEPGALTVTTTPVADRTLRNVVSKDGAEMDTGIGLVTYARSCVINGKSVPHLVIQGEHGPVTLLLMPGESVETAVPLSGEAVHGVILPLGEGSIAIIGDRAERLDEIERRVVDSVKWSI